MRIHGFMTFLLLHFVSSKGERREKWQQGHKWAEAASALSLKLMQFCLIEGGGHTNWQIEQICAINCGIQWNATNKSITKYENLFGVKSIFESIQRFARYRIGALILIGRLCITSRGTFCFFPFDSFSKLHSCFSQNSARNTGPSYQNESCDSVSRKPLDGFKIPSNTK